MPGQAQQESWSRCKSDDDLERRIRGCPVLIESGQETGSDLAKALRSRGSAYAHNGDFDHAFQAYDQALGLNSTDDDAFYERGNAYSLKGNYDRATKDYDQAMRLAPQSCEPV
jgi:tetratricopeptide (TPR) repeat protein